MDRILERYRGWFSQAGPDFDIVLSSRVRLSRNLKGYLFPEFMSAQQEKDVENKVLAAVMGLPEKPLIYALNSMEPLEKRILLERNLITQDYSLDQSKTVVLGPNESYSMMINAEDHIRLSSIQSGNCLDAVYKLVDSIDSGLDGRLEYAFSVKWGFLSNDLINLGTGLRASFMLHLPALIQTGLLNKTIKAVSQVGLAVKGFFSEGNTSLGDIYQISNQTSLGSSEDEILDNINTIIHSLMRYERMARTELLEKNRVEIEDMVYRAYGILKFCRSISLKEAIELLSRLRLGISLGLIAAIPLEQITSLFFITQKSHIQKIMEKEIAEKDIRLIDYTRAKIIRETILQHENRGEENV